MTWLPLLGGRRTPTPPPGTSSGHAGTLGMSSLSSMPGVALSGFAPGSSQEVSASSASASMVPGEVSSKVPTSSLAGLANGQVLFQESLTPAPITSSLNTSTLEAPYAQGGLILENSPSKARALNSEGLTSTPNSSNTSIISNAQAPLHAHNLGLDHAQSLIKASESMIDQEQYLIKEGLNQVSKHVLPSISLGNQFQPSTQIPPSLIPERLTQKSSHAPSLVLGSSSLNQVSLTTSSNADNVEGAIQGALMHVASSLHVTPTHAAPMHENSGKLQTSAPSSLGNSDNALPKSTLVTARPSYSAITKGTRTQAAPNIYVFGNTQPLSGTSIVQVNGANVFKFNVKVNEMLSASLKFALVGKFSQEVSRTHAIISFFQKMGIKGHYELKWLSQRQVMFVFELEEDYARVWTKGLWHVDSCPMCIIKWTPEYDARKESSIIPVWVQFPGLPAHLYDRRALYFIASALGKPLMTDTATAKKERDT